MDVLNVFLEMAVTDAGIRVEIDQPDALGNTALSSACAAGQVEAVRALLKAKRPGLKGISRAVTFIAAPFRA